MIRSRSCGGPRWLAGRSPASIQVLLLVVILGLSACSTSPPGATAGRASSGPWAIERLVVDGEEIDASTVVVNRAEVDTEAASLELRLRLCRTISFSWQLVQGADKPYGLRPRDAIVSTGDCADQARIENALIEALRQARRIEPNADRLVLDSSRTRVVLSRY